jgi:beta-lactamase regulating signal transducer with metallopeptidase domain
MTILGTVGVALLFIIGIVLLFIPTNGRDPGALFGVIYMLLTLLYFYPIKKSFDLIKNTRDAMGNASQMGLEQAAANVKSILKYFGILSIVCLSIYALLFVIGFIVGMASALV